MAKRKRNATKSDSLGIECASLKHNKRLRKRCTHTHADIVSYKEEGDKRYFKKDMELFNTKCAKCKKHFSNVDGDNIIVPSIANPVYVCLGRNKYNCSHSICHKCYHIMAGKCNKAPKHRRSTRNNKVT